MNIKTWEDQKRVAKGQSSFVIRVNLPCRKPITRYFATPRERKDWREQFERDLMEGRYAVTKDSKIESRQLSWCAQQYLLASQKRGCRNTTLTKREYYLEKFTKFMNNAPVGSIERTDVVRFIESHGANSTRLGVCGNIVSFLTWCGNADQGRDWVPQNKFINLQWMRQLEDEKQPCILTPKEAKKLLYAIADDKKAGLALSLFTGIRTRSELPHLKWSDIDFSRKRIHVRITKIRRGRTITDLPPALWKWLKKYKSTGGIIQSKPAQNAENQYNAFRLARSRTAKRIGIDYGMNAARHSFGSYGYWKGEEWARRTMGHTEGSRTYHKHYVNNGPSEKQSKKFFSIKPEK